MGRGRESGSQLMVPAGELLLAAASGGHLDGSNSFASTRRRTYILPLGPGTARASQGALQVLAITSISQACRGPTHKPGHEEASVVYSMIRRGASHASCHRRKQVPWWILTSQFGSQHLK